MPYALTTHKQRTPSIKSDNRQSASRRGYDGRWQRYRKMFLARHPLCAECCHAATDVDHIKAVTSKDDPLFWDEGNHQALCHSCHSAKTTSENGGFGNKKNG